jgi:hypothetical protein
MNARYALSWTGAIAACSLTVALTASRAASARSLAARSRAAFLRVSADLHDLAALNASLSPRLSPANTQPLSGRLSAAAAQAGLPASCISSVSPEAQSAITTDAGARVLKRRASVTLASLTLSQFGRLLERWRSANPDWVVTTIDITPASVTPPAAGGDLPLSISITLESLAIADPGAAR